MRSDEITSQYALVGIVLFYDFSAYMYATLKVYMVNLESIRTITKITVE